ncbi:MAG: hypothetical protein CMA65_05195 [Euryarchaeota archaeon]|nr:hypothetical protein [Euryarchaeota archaeon]
MIRSSHPSAEGSAVVLNTCGQRCFIDLKSILENTIEQARKISELHQGVSSLVARKYVTTKIPIPYTALNAANNRNPRNSGLFFTLIFKEFQAAIASTRFSFTL